MAKLGLNIDHVATVRNARGITVPDPIQAALIGEQFGADGITAHLREDRRHIRDKDIFLLKETIQTRLNLEMANTIEMVQIACKVKPYMVTIVPERREELTTEGGLDVIHGLKSLTYSIQTLKEAGILVSLFIDPDSRQVEASLQSGAQIVEFHTGKYCEAYEKQAGKHGVTLPDQEATHLKELSLLIEAAKLCNQVGLEVNAGHGLNYHNVQPILLLPGLVELNIGHSIIAEAIFTGIGPAVQRMKALIQ
ncbi:MAG: pyridoxine 5'-phosphate synthase [Cyanobacteria bacterium]|nr:pyridoxine 5'-phosphate synthase [Cyanobacteriota bacterium]